MKRKTREVQGELRFTTICNGYREHSEIRTMLRGHFALAPCPEETPIRLGPPLVERGMVVGEGEVSDEY